jgi:hypothetical protein
MSASHYKGACILDFAFAFSFLKKQCWVFKGLRTFLIIWSDRLDL